MITRKMLRQFGCTRWLRFGVRDRIIRAFDHPDRCSQETFSVPFFNLRYHGHFDQYIDWSVFYYGAYSIEELDFLAEVLKRLNKPIFIDVGANVGQHSLFASRFASFVHSFEPFHIVADQFEDHIERNGIRNIRLHRVALGSANETLGFRPPMTRNLGTGTFTLQNGDSIQLKVRKGDEYLKESGIERVDLIKIDTEGFEVEVLRGLDETLRTHRPLVFFEWTPQKQSKCPSNPLALFPSEYVLFRFIPEVVVALFFRHRSHRLCTVSNECAIGNYVAVPAESVDRLLHPN